MTTKPAINTFGVFIQLIKKWLRDMGVNAKLFHELAADESLPIQTRSLAVGVLLYLDAVTDLIPEKIRFIGLIDDMLVMIISLVFIIPQISEERLSYYGQKYEAVNKMGEYEPIVRGTLGILWERISQFIETLHKRTFRSKTTEEVAKSAELREAVFDETMICIANMGIDPETLDNDVKQLPSPEKVIGLLSSGLERSH